jgi:hypothetical protein
MIRRRRTNYLKPKFLYSLVLVYGGLVAFPLIADSTNAEKSASEFTSDTHHFQGLKLKGELKQPKFTYRPRQNGTTPEEQLVMPANFDSAIYRVIKEK